MPGMGTLCDGIKPVFCGHDCGGDACPLLATVESGRVVRISHNPSSGRYIRGCRKGYELPAFHYSPKRLRVPLIAAGPRGSGQFREASWDEALDLVTRRLGDIRARHGADSILRLASAGSTGALHDTEALSGRYLNATGGCCNLSGSYSNGAARSVLPWILGPEWKDSGFDASTMRHASLIILWGANIPDTRLGAETPSRLAEAAARGVPLVVIDPRRTAATRLPGARWIPCRPGTDAAFMLALLFVLLEENLVDHGFVAERAAGFETLAAYVRGYATAAGSATATDSAGSANAEPKSPEWAEAITGVDAAVIRDLARLWASTKPAMLFPGYSIQRVAGGEECFRLTVALQLATGNFGIPGGSTGSLNNRLRGPRVGRIGDFSAPGAPSVPLLRWPDAILEGRSGGYPADIAAAYVAGCNYLNQGADIAKSRVALEALEFSVCHEMFLTPTAQYCDVVLPVASPLEKEDIGIPWAGNYLLYKDRVVRTEGLARSDFDIFADLADRAGAAAGAAFSEGKSEHEWVESFLADSEVGDRSGFKKSGFFGIESERAGCDAFAADPSGHPLGTASGKVELECRAYAEATGFSAIPIWKAPPRDPAYPLDLVTPKMAWRTHSQSGASENNGVDPVGRPHGVSIHPADAKTRGIADGDRIRLRNERGSVVSAARLSDDIMPGTLSLPEGIWFDPGAAGEDLSGSANFLTSTAGTGATSACVMHAIPVEAEKLP